MNDRDTLRAYLATTWSVRISGGTLRLSPGRPAPRPLRPSAIVTAYNPFSQPAPDTNRAAARRLLARAADSGVPCLPSRAHGTGPERLCWSEPGLALLGPAALDTAIALAVEYRQNAILAVAADGRVEIIATRNGFCGRAVGATLHAPAIQPGG